MKFSAFIVANQQAILDEWVRHARTLLPAAGSMSLEQLEDHGRQLVLAIAEDMDTPQSEAQRFAKSQYIVADPALAPSAAAQHGRSRQLSGFDPMQMHGEFRALRASILGLWARSDLADTGAVGAEEIARFNEALDQALAEVLRITREGERYGAHLRFLDIPLDAELAIARFLQGER